MASFEPSRPSPPDSHGRPWLFWGTVFWLGLAMLAMLIAQSVGFVAMSSSVIATRSDVAASLADFNTMSALLLISYPFALAVLACAAHVRRWRPRDYFALYAVTWRQFGYGAASLFGALLATGLIGMAAGKEAEPEFMNELFAAVRNGGNVALMFVAIVVVAPIAEEIIFRGFLFRGLAATRVGVMGAIIISAAVWASIHTQYDAFYMSVIFIVGLVMGGLRAWSGSTLLPLVLHVLMNALSFSQAWLPQTA